VFIHLFAHEVTPARMACWSFRRVLCVLAWHLPLRGAADKVLKVAKAPSNSSAVPLADYMRDAGEIKGIHVLYSFPGSFYPPHHTQPADVPAAGSVAPKGIFVMLHACGHLARHFYELPEEVEMSIAVLQRGYAIFAPDAYPMPGGCWGPSHDGILVRDALESWLDEHGLADKPLYGLGVSNGGVMLSYLYSVMGVRFHGMHFNVSPGGAIHDDGGTFATSAHPPVTFVRMLGDPYAPVPTIDAAAAALRHAGSPVKVFDCPPQPIGLLYLRAEKIPLSRRAMEKILQRIDTWGVTEWREGPVQSQFKNLPRLHQKYIAYGTGKLVVNGLMEDPELVDIVRNHLAALAEEIYVIEGHHAPTSQHVGESLDFILQGRKPRSLLRMGAGQGLKRHSDM